MPVSQARAHAAWRMAETIKQLSDRLVGIGPFGIGLDGVLAWVPWAGTAYSIGGGGLLMYQALQAGCSVSTLARMGLYLVADSATSTVPIAGWAVDTLFPAHLMAAKAMQKDIEVRFGPAPLPEGVERRHRARAGRRGFAPRP